MKPFAQILLAALITCAAAVPAVAQNERTRSFTPKDTQNPAPKPEQLGVPPETSAPTPQKQDVQAECRPNWTAKKYRSFDSLQTEIKKRYGEVRILRVALCGEGTTAAYFQIVILSGEGSVSRIQIAATN